jgi:cytochrome c oxidase subunit III
MYSDTEVAESEPEKSGNAGGGTTLGGGESRLPGGPGTPRRAYTTAMVIALAGILMFFAAFISAGVVRKGSPSGDWRSLIVPHVLWLNTAILLASSFSLTRARSRFLLRDNDGFCHWWRITTILGGFFIAGQWIAWRQLASSGIYLATNPSVSFFYILTAAHGLHVAAGLLALLFVAFRKRGVVPSQTAIDVIGIYWHFMDAVWIFLFVFLLAT